MKARLGLMRSALAGVHCDQREVRVQRFSAVLPQPSSWKVAAFWPLPQNAGRPREVINRGIHPYAMKVYSQIWGQIPVHCSEQSISCVSPKVCKS